MRSEDLFFGDMLRYGRRVIAFLDGMDQATFLQDEAVNLAVTHLMQMIGEAARVIPEDARSRFPQLPWRQIVGMRHIIVHEYHRLSLKPIWDTAVNDIPVLVTLLEPHYRAWADEPQREPP